MLVLRVMCCSGRILTNPDDDGSTPAAPSGATWSDGHSQSSKQQANLKLNAIQEELHADLEKIRDNSVHTEVRSELDEMLVTTPPTD